VKDEKSTRTPVSLIKHLDTRLSVERVNPSELDTVAGVLAAAYADDSVHIWAMANAATWMADAMAFFTFFLRRMRPCSNWKFVLNRKNPGFAAKVVDDRVMYKLPQLM